MRFCKLGSHSGTLTGTLCTRAAPLACWLASDYSNRLVRTARAGHSLSCKKPTRFITQTQEPVGLLAADQKRVIIAMIRLYLPLKRDFLAFLGLI